MMNVFKTQQFLFEQNEIFFWCKNLSAFDSPCCNQRRKFHTFLSMLIVCDHFFSFSTVFEKCIKQTLMVEVARGVFSCESF
jgi:hypothetical protein